MGVLGVADLPGGIALALMDKRLEEVPYEQQDVEAAVCQDTENYWPSKKTEILSY